MLTVSERVLGASEAYYLLVDRLWPVNAHCAVDIAADATAVRAAWAATVERMPVLGATIQVIDSKAEVVFGGKGAPEIWSSFATVEDAMAAQATVPLDIHRAVARCALVERDGLTTAVIAAHHSLFDGRALAQISLTLTTLAGGEEPAEQPLFHPTVSVDALMAERIDVRRRRRELLALAREVRGEDSYLDHADRLSWHNPKVHESRDLASALFSLDGDQSKKLLAYARGIGATVYGVTAAAVLRCCAELSTETKRLALSTPVDLRAANGLPDFAPIGQAAALISGSYDVTVSDDELARAISTGVRQRVDRGEAELIFALTGAERMPVGPDSDEMVRRWTADVTPTVCVSNVGVIPGPLPSVFRGFTVTHAPTPNQSIFFVIATVGGRMHAILSYDRNRISIDGAQLAAGIQARLRALAGS